jgi:undecaprenyl-diphosphatase
VIPGADPDAARRWNLVVLSVAAAVLVVCTLAALAPLTDAEVALFRAANELPQSLYPAIWPLMQYGTFITIPVLVVVALLFRRRWLALAMAIAGVGVYVIARGVKAVVERGRPGDLLAGVEGRETFGPESLGYPSGHAAVAGALTVVVAGQLSRRWALVALAVGLVVLFGRLYVGAHLPLDVVGGAALGAVGGAIANLVVDGIAARRDQPAADPNRSSNTNAQPGT